MPMDEPRERKRYEHAITTAASHWLALEMRAIRVVVIPVGRRGTRISLDAPGKDLIFFFLRG